MWPGLASHFRLVFLPVHASLGAAIFLLGSGAALLGLTEKAIWTLGSKWQVNRPTISEPVFINLLRSPAIDSWNENAICRTGPSEPVFLNVRL